MTEVPLHHLRESRVERALNSALSRGPGYEPVPIGQRFDVDSVRGYYIDYAAKTAGGLPADLEDLPPSPTIQLALGWWERHLGGDDRALEHVLALCAEIERRADRLDGELRWPTRVVIAKHQLMPPWYSALPQGQAASVFVRAHLATGDDRYADSAVRAIRPLLVSEGSDIVTQTGSGPILEEAPSDPGSHILNGWISAMWGLWDVHLGLGDGPAGAVFERTLRCLGANLDAYDTGWWTRYSLYPHALEDLAKPIYHRQHVDQVAVLHRLTGDPRFEAARSRWASYDRPLNRAAALAQKAAFTALDAPRRRRWLRSVGSR